MAKTLYDYCMERDNVYLLNQWDQEMNEGTTVHDVSHGSHKRVWWRCERGHRWQAVVYTRAGAGAGCPYCSGKKLSLEENTLAARFPDLAKQWHTSKNVGITPDDVFPATHRKVWWICEKGHEWQAAVNSRTKGSGCPICANRRVIPGENDLATTHPYLAVQWHPAKNGTLKPQDTVAGNGRKVWWQCEKGHAWQAAIVSRSSNGDGCPVCQGKKVIPGVNDLATAFSELAAQWHPEKNGRLTPQNVTAYSNRKAWWICKQGHEYASVIAARATKAADCPYCTGRKVLPGFNDLETKEPKLAAQWHPDLNGTLTPQMVTVGSHKKVWWRCSEDHVWKAVVYSRAGGKKSGCPVCAGKVKSAPKVEVCI